MTVTFVVDTVNTPQFVGVRETAIEGIALEAFVGFRVIYLLSRAVTEPTVLAQAPVAGVPIYPTGQDAVGDVVILTVGLPLTLSNLVTRLRSNPAGLWSY